MNPAPQTQNPAPPVRAPEPSAPTPFAYRGNGKVARLPKPIRDQINQWMFDGLSYPNIIHRLGQQAEDLNPGHLCEWRKRGYQDWLLQQAWLAETRARQEPAADLSAGFDATQLNHAALQLGTLHMFEALRDLNSPHPSDGRGINGEGTGSHDNQVDQALGDHGNSPSRGANTQAEEVVPTIEIQNSKFKNRSPRSQLDLRLGGDSSAFVRLMNALARASRETMLVQKYRETCARARAAIRELKDPNRKLSEKETRAIVRKVDEILGFCSPEDDEPESGKDPSGQSPAGPPPDSIGSHPSAFTTPD